MNLAPQNELGSYRILDKLGEGGMGVVWRALDTRLDREVALKVMPSASAEVPGRLQRFEREARAVAALNHPNIVTLYSVEEEGGVRFLTMELVEGQTLARVIPAEGMTTERFFEVAVPLTDALRAAHEQGVVHRDLKPSNVMIDREGRLKVLDFGLAKLHARPEVETIDTVDVSTRSLVTGIGRMIGTIPYMSPEQVRGQVVDHRTDIFSVGVMFYEMATGGRPFEGVSRDEVVSSILQLSPRSVSELRPTIPVGVGRIVDRCLEKPVDRRYASAEKLRDDLIAERERAFSGWSKRSRKIAAAVGVVALLVLVAAGVALLRPGAVHSTRPSTVAILPFANLTGDPGMDYLAEGISSALITQVGELTEVRVLGPVGALGGTAEGSTTRAAARRFGADTILEGTLQQAGERLQIDVALTDGESGVVIWSQEFTGGATDALRVQKEIGHQLAVVLSIPLSAGEKRRLTREPTRSFEAFDYFLRGHRLLVGPAEAESLNTAITLLRQATKIDPRFALAHVDLSVALWRSHQRGGGEPMLLEAEREARRALELDPELPSAFVALARVHRGTGKSAESIEEITRTLESHPKPAEAYRELAQAYSRVGDLEQTESCLRSAVDLAASDWVVRNELGAFFFESGRFDEARAAWEKAGELAPPTVQVPEENLASLLVVESRFGEAIAAFERLPGPITSAILASNLATAYFYSQREDGLVKAVEYYRLAVRLDPRRPDTRRNLADVYLELGRETEALRHYGEALRLTEDRLRLDPGHAILRLRQAHYRSRVNDCEQAIAVADALAGELPEGAVNFHDLAYPYAICGEDAKALEAIRRSIEFGYPGAYMREEPEFRALADSPEFVRLTSSES